VGERRAPHFFLFSLFSFSRFMWVIFFHDTPHFWLVGGESYRVGKRDCHVVIQDDRSISRVHLTIRVGLPPDSESHDAGREKGIPSLLPQPITLIDSSTYGTSIASAAEEVEGGEAQDSGALHSTTTAFVDTGIVGLRYAPSAATSSGRSGSESNKNGSGTKTGNRPPPRLLAKGVPYDVPVQRASWRQFFIYLGHHGAVLRLAWVDVAVLCEDVEMEMQTKLQCALQYCGVRQVFAPTLPPPPPPPEPLPLQRNAESVAAASSSSSALQPAQRLCRNTLGERSASGSDGGSTGGALLPAILGGSGMLSLSQSTSATATSCAPGPSLIAATAAPGGAGAAPSHPTQFFTGGLAAVRAVAACYNAVDFLVTSTVQPSTAVVGMLCRAVPIVSPSFFVAIRDRVSPQLPLPDPHRFIPPLSTWWCDLLQHTRQALPDVSSASNGDGGSLAEDTLATAAPSSSSANGAPATRNTAATAAAEEAVDLPPLQQQQLSEYFAPCPRRRELFAGVTFVVVQRGLYEEVMSYLDCTGAAVVWEGKIGEWVMPDASPTEGLSFSSTGFRELQSFFTRHQRHVLLFNETEGMPFQHCLAVLQGTLGLCSVEYGTLIESIALAHPPPLGDFPDNARAPQTETELQARVRLACGEASSARGSDTQDSAWEAEGPGCATTQEATEGRRTDAQPLFPDILVGTEGDEQQGLHRKGERAVGDGALHAEARLHKRPRREDADGWVTLGKLTTASDDGMGVVASASITATSTGGHPGKTAAAAVRTVDLLCSPCVLPPYPCFAEAHTTASSRSDHSLEQRKGFVKQTLPPAEPLVELEEHRARRQLAAGMLVARVPTVDADTVVPDQVVMGSRNTNSSDRMTGGTPLLSGSAELAAAAAFNTFDTVVHHASSKRKATVARRGKGSVSGVSGRPPHHHHYAATVPAPSAGVTERRAAGPAAAINVDDVEEAEPPSTASNSTFQIFDIDGIF
jgi:hypothetical protein